jgi:glycosyltransferase involved in cell wall biosynthesis
MKKILVVHNKYQQLGGEDIAVENEIQFLKKYYEVRVLYFDNEITTYFKQILYFILNKNISSAKILRTTIEEFNPDLVYVHNTWFKASVSIFTTLKKSKIPTLVKLHNFRYDCTRSIFISRHLNNTNQCLACGLENKEKRFINLYFEESILKSILVFIYGRKYFKILRNNKEIKIAVLTEFHKSYLIKLGFSDDRIFVYPNYIEGENTQTNLKKKKQIVYAGRISKEKGVEELITAFLKTSLNDYELILIGLGPHKKLLEEQYQYQNIKFLGQLPNIKVKNILQESTAVVTATKLYEGQPTLLCEASLSKVPSIFPDTGGVKEFFPKNTQYIFEQFNYQDLVSKLESLSNLNQVEKEGKKNYDYLKAKISISKIKSNFDEMIQS